MNLQITQLQHHYKSPSGETHTVLNIPEWELQKGDHILLRGVSGSGKTTLFNILAGLLTPSQGQICYERTDLFRLLPRQQDAFRARHIGYIFQNHYLLPHLTALENTIMPLSFARQKPSNEWRKIATQLLEQVGLGKFLHYHPHQLSTGQRLRVAVARALVNQPPVILADEPTAALDPESAQQIMTLLQTFAQQAILIVASHDPSLNVHFAKTIHLQHGQLQEVAHHGI